MTFTARTAEYGFFYGFTYFGKAFRGLAESVCV